MIDPIHDASDPSAHGFARPTTPADADSRHRLSDTAGTSPAAPSSSFACPPRIVDSDLQQHRSAPRRRRCLPSIDRRTASARLVASCESSAASAVSATSATTTTASTTTSPSMAAKEQRRSAISRTFGRSESASSGIHKFLAWFSGRRRNIYQRCRVLVPYFTMYIVLSLLQHTDACSSRTIPKPRPPTPTPRPNITFHTYKCPPAYAAWYCLNDATCFTVKIGESLLYNCECADGYMGPRCEYKDLDGSYLPSRQRVMLETASIASGATLALVLVLILCVFFYVKWHQQQKQERLEREQQRHDANANEASTGVDTVDGGGSSSAAGLHSVRCGPPELRPFGPHHQRTIPMAEALLLKR